MDPNEIIKIEHGLWPATRTTSKHCRLCNAERIVEENWTISIGVVVFGQIRYSESHLVQKITFKARLVLNLEAIKASLIDFRVIDFNWSRTNRLWTAGSSTSLKFNDWMHWMQRIQITNIRFYRPQIVVTPNWPTKCFCTASKQLKTTS